MSDILSAIADDIREYERLCEQFGEDVKYYIDGSVDCYGEHAKALKERARQLECRRAQALAKLTDEDRAVLRIE